MLDKILGMAWDDIMDSDFLFKSHAYKHVVEISGEEISPDDKSKILIYYNVYTGVPMIVLVRYEAEDMPDPVYTNKNYSFTKTSGVDEDGNKYTEFVFVLSQMQKALED